jgi:hypothetical protein
MNCFLQCVRIERMAEHFFSHNTEQSQGDLTGHRVSVIKQDILTLRRFIEDNRAFIPEASFPAQEMLLTSYAKINSDGRVHEFIMSSGSWYPDITALSDLSGLQALCLWGGAFKEIPDFSKCGDLEKLHLRSCKEIKSFDVLSGASSLKELNLEGSPLYDTSPIRNLSQLEEARLSYCNIRSLEPLTACRRLRIVQVWQSHFGFDCELDISPLLSLPNLEQVWVTPSEQNKQIRIALMDRDIQVIDWDPLAGARSGSRL